MSTRAPELTRSAVVALEEYEWPGNVRELMNVAERTVILNEGTQVSSGDLPLAAGPAESANKGLRDIPTRFAAMPLEQARSIVVSEFEREYLIEVLTKTQGQVGEAARRAEIDPKTLYSKMRAHGLDKADFRALTRKTGINSRKHKVKMPDSGRDIS